jgi:hypothetical protein
MSKIRCLCGHTISDNTDFINYKARFIADQDYFDLLDEIESADWTKRANSLYKYSQEIYQCMNCQNVIFLIENERIDFQPINKEKSVNLLYSTLGKEWKGFLRAYFAEEKGEIWWNTNVDSGYKKIPNLDELKKIYFDKFEELLKLNILRNCFLRINGTIEHEFSTENNEKM